jgi:DNA-binding beta-propeller fold protein YncE
MNKSFIRTPAAFAVALCAFQFARADDTPATAPSPEYAVVDTFKLGGEGRWDYATFDPAAHLLYVTRQTHTQVIDPTTGKLAADIAPQQRSHGVAIATTVGRGFISDGEGADVQVFGLKTNAVLGKIATADDSDGIIYDPGADRVLVACGDAAKLIVFPPSIDLSIGKPDSVDLGGKPEFLAADGKGNAYVNINDKSEIAVVNLKTLAVTSRWPIAPGTNANGLAIDPVKGRLFIGCRNEKMIVMSTDDGHVIADLPIGRGNDACGFDPATGEAFASCGDGTLTVVKETDPNKFEGTKVTTKLGARTMAVDSAAHKIYLPDAKMEAPPAGSANQRPVSEPGTFMIVVVGSPQK